MPDFFYIGNLDAGEVLSPMSKEDIISLVESNPNMCKGETSFVQMDYLVRSIRDDNSMVVYVEEAGEMKGVVVFSKVHDEIQLPVICASKGYGSLLLSKVKEIAGRLGVISIRLVSKKATTDFYLKNGFTVVGNTGGFLFFMEYSVAKGGSSRKRIKKIRTRKSIRRRKTKKILGTRRRK